MISNADCVMNIPIRLASKASFNDRSCIIRRQDCLDKKITPSESVSRRDINNPRSPKFGRPKAERNSNRGMTNTLGRLFHHKDTDG